VLDSTGSATVRLDPTLVYKFILKDSGGSTQWTEDYYQADNLTATSIGLLLYPQTAAEISAGVTPTNYGYPELNVLRYGTNTTPGTTDMTTPLNNMLLVAKAKGGGVAYIPAGTYYCTSRVGNDNQGTSDFSDNVTIRGDGMDATILIWQSSYNGACLSLQGNNTAIRDLTVTSQRTIDHHANLVTQRTPYQNGILIGSKNSVGTLSVYKTGAQVTRCKVTNMNLPIQANQCANVVLSDNVVDEFTDTGIIAQDCTTDIWIERNKITRGGDDCIFVRHYSTSAWAVAGNYCGRVKIKDNFTNDTFGKNIGQAGYGDVEISGNYCGLSWAGGINLEKDGWYSSNAATYRNYLIANNEIVDAGRNWNTAEAYAPHNSANPGANPSGIQTVYGNTHGSVNYTNVNILNNTIVNPYYDCLALASLDYVFISGNTFTPGATNHGAGSVNTQNCMVDITDSVTFCVAMGNKTSVSLGVTPTYTHSVASGSGTTNNIVFANNFDVFGTEAVTYSDGSARTGTTFSTLHYGDQGVITLAAATSKLVTLSRYQPDANYRVALSQSATTTSPPWVTAKAVNQFLVNFSAAYTGDVEWIISR
jgi:hypothetical protein